jgi:hypothetical protein
VAQQTRLVARPRQTDGVLGALNTRWSEQARPRPRRDAVTLVRDASGGVRRAARAAVVTEVELSTGSTVRTPEPAEWIAETVRTGQPGDIMLLDFRDGHGRDQVAFVRLGFVAAVRSVGG